MGKHKQIKAVDPFLAGPRREKRIREQKQVEAGQDKAPFDPDEQEPPRSYTRMLEDIKEANKPLGQKRKESNERRRALLEHKKKFEKPEVGMQKGESNKKYLMRVAKSSNKRVRDVQMKLLENPEDDKNQKSSDKSKRRLALLKKKAEAKKVEKNIDLLEREFFTDNVAFGEVVQSPPQLTSKPRGGKPSTEKSGQRQLLLSSLLSKSGQIYTGSQGRASAKTKKRKAMTLHERKTFDERQSAAVDAYRKLKRQRTPNKRT